MGIKTFDWDAYGRMVLAGEILVCKWTRLAVERHYNDLKTGHERGLFFSEAHAQHVLEFFLFLRHSKGEWTGQQFVLSPWQQWCTAVLFGWLRTDGTRRFRDASKYVPRKNGKSTWVSGEGLYLFFADGEGGAEVYTAATKRDQAKITHEEATRMVSASSLLKRHIRINKDKLFIPGRADKFEPLGRDSDSLDGLNPSGVIIDEYHAHRNRDLVDVLKTGMGARRQPLMIKISTAGTDFSSACYEDYQYSQKILDGTIVDDAFFCIIYGLDEGDDYTDPAMWIKANPNLGVSVYPEYIASQVEKSQNVPSERNNVLTKLFNRWVTGEVSFIEPEAWNACADPSIKREQFKGFRNKIALDLASKIDIAAEMQVFERAGHYYIFGRYYLPKARIGAANVTAYKTWEAQSNLITTPGETIDMDLVEDNVLALAVEYASEEVAFDPWQATQMAAHLMAEGVEMVEMRPIVRNFSEPMKELQSLVLQKRIHHDGDPVLAWMISNVVVEEDRKGCIFPRKQLPQNKIDGAVALIMALGRLITGAETTDINEFIMNPIAA